MLEGAPAGEVELAGVHVDVGLEPRDPVALAGAGDRGGEEIELREQRIWPFGRDEVVSARDLQEGDADMTVLGLAARDGKVRTQRGGDVQLEVAARDVGRGRDRARAGLEPRHQPGAVSLLAEPRGLDRRGGLAR